jgi:hypothetical protein
MADSAVLTRSLLGSGGDRHGLDIAE